MLLVPGAFSLEGESYNFLQSKGRDKIRVLRRDGDKGAVTLPWKVTSHSGLIAINYLYLGLFMKDVRSLGFLCEQGKRGFFRCGRPNKIFENYRVSV